MLTPIVPFHPSAVRRSSKITSDNHGYRYSTRGNIDSRAYAMGSVVSVPGLSKESISMTETAGDVPIEKLSEASPSRLPQEESKEERRGCYCFRCGPLDIDWKRSETSISATRCRHIFCVENGIIKRHPKSLEDTSTHREDLRFLLVLLDRHRGGLRDPLLTHFPDADDDDFVPRPATSLTVEALSKSTFRKDVLGEVSTCAICFDEFADRKSRVTSLKCSHTFHYACMRKWLLWRSTCPVCRCVVAGA